MRLYLLKDAKQDLFVDFPRPLPQHQLDGIRFLYKQFKKKNPGVILNDPPGYGKRMQVVLFLKGIKPLLQKPIFVICPRESITKWKEHFVQYAGYAENDIAVDSSNAFAKYLVFINTIEDVSAFCRRHWSIVIFENNEFHKDTANITKKVLHFSLNSEFKIWVTSVDIKAHLDLFPSMYNWLNPGDKTNVRDLTQKGNGLKDEIEKNIILEAFLEDIVIRRDNFLTPLKNIKTEENRNEVNLEETRKRSRKCKDITGEKIKRSKYKVVEVNDNVVFPLTAQNNSTVNVSKVTVSIDNNSDEYFNFINEHNNEVTENNEMDVETFIRDQEPIKSMQSNNANDMSQTEGNTSDFINAVNEIVSNENNIARDENDSPSLFDVVEEESGKTRLVDASDVFNGNFKTPKNNDILIMKEEDTILSGIGENEKLKEETSEEIKVNNVKTFDSVDNNCKVATSGDGKLNIKKEETNSNAIPKIDEEVSVKKETENKIIVKKDITEQLADLENEAANRFKGSILDNLFKF